MRIFILIVKVEDLLTTEDRFFKFILKSISRFQLRNFYAQTSTLLLLKDWRTAEASGL